MALYCSIFNHSPIIKLKGNNNMKNKSMYNRIMNDINTRMEGYHSSLEPTDDEVSICYLLCEMEHAIRLLGETDAILYKISTQYPSLFTNEDGLDEIFQNNMTFLENMIEDVEMVIEEEESDVK